MTTDNFGVVMAMLNSPEGLSFGGQRMLMDPSGSGSVLVWNEPEPLALLMPVHWEPPPPERLDFKILQSYGGIVRPPDRIISIDFKPLGIEAMIADGWTRCSRPSRVMAAIKGAARAGGQAFIRVRGEPLGEWCVDDAGGDAVVVPRSKFGSDAVNGMVSVVTERAGPGGWRRADGGFILCATVDSGRYANRLPTNRKRKRERAKARRRERRDAR